jgi:light-regulated signal transduction histidine kinase (bacteriophytochrome)
MSSLGQAGKPEPQMADRSSMDDSVTEQCRMRSTLATSICLLVLLCVGPAGAQTGKLTIFVVSSYHREYLRSQDTQKGLCAGLIEFGFIDNANQAAEFTKNDCVESDELKAVELAVAVEETHGTLSIPEFLPRVRGDGAQIRQLLQNLVSNALKYHKKDVLPEVVVRATLHENGMVRVEVQDNGIGIEEQHYDKLFVMFRRLHSSDEYEGTGIGLAVCKRIVERHNGEIGIRSIPGEGSTFWFTLPASQASDERNTRTAASPEPCGCVTQGVLT